MKQRETENILIMTASDIFNTLIKVSEEHSNDALSCIRKEMECSDYQPPPHQRKNRRVTQIIYSNYLLGNIALVTEKMVITCLKIECGGPLQYQFPCGT